MIEDIYVDALLAAAAYADWGPNSLTVDIKAELIKQGFTPAQMDDLFFGANPRYEVVPNGYTDDLNGFSATIFKNIDPTSANFNQTTVAFRGTNVTSVADWLTNISVVFSGLLDTNLSDFLGRQDDSISVFLQQAGLLTNGVLDAGVDFTGHSLGGFLSTIAAYKYSDTMGQATTFNGLGVSLSDYISNEVINGISLTGKINNYYADFVGANVGHHPGVNTEIFIEKSNLLEDHYMVNLVKSLSVYRVLSLLDPSLESDLTTIYNILDAATNEADQSLAITVDKPGDLLGGNLSTQSNKDDIELFYQEAEAYLTGLGNTVNIVTASSLSSAATSNSTNGYAYRYALVNLNAFAITGDVSLYTQHNTGGVLDAANFNQEYLTDRAHFLSLHLERNQVNNTSNYQFGDQDIISRAYYDAGANVFFYSGTNPPDAGSTSRETVPDFVERIYFGNDDNNTFMGGDKNDRLYGMGGTDQLTGGKGNDILSGGTGDDTYLFSTNDGLDHIIDATHDAGDRIHIDGINLSTYSFKEVVPGSGLYDGVPNSSGPDISLSYHGTQ